MNTQVATSHTTARTHITPLKVPRRPARNDVTQAIHKFLPYVVVFLLSLMLYSSFKSSKTEVYPPYSPPNHLSEETAQPSPIDIANIINKKNERLAEMRRKVEGDSNGWAAWRAQKASELNANKQAAEQQMKEGIKSIPIGFQNAYQTMAIKYDDVVQEAMDAAEFWKSYGEQMVQEVRERGAEKISDTRDFAYDSMYSWKQKAGELKDSAADKLGDIKDAAMEKAEVAKETVADVKDAAEDTFQRVEVTVEKVAEEFADVARDTLENARETVSEWGSAGLEKAKDTLESAKDTLASTIESAKDVAENTVESAKDILESARDSVADRASELKADISQAAYDFKQRSIELDTDRRVDLIVEQLQSLGDGAIDEVLRRLDRERSECQCPDDGKCSL